MSQIRVIASPHTVSKSARCTFWTDLCAPGPVAFTMVGRPGARGAFYGFQLGYLCAHHLEHAHDLLAEAIENGVNHPDRDRWAVTTVAAHVWKATGADARHLFWWLERNPPPVLVT